MEKDYLIKDPAPFRAKDDSYHGDMKSVESANEFYVNKMKELIPNPNLDLL